MHMALARRHCHLRRVLLRGEVPRVARWDLVRDSICTLVESIYIRMLWQLVTELV